MRRASSRRIGSINAQSILCIDLNSNMVAWNRRRFDTILGSGYYTIIVVSSGCSSIDCALRSLAALIGSDGRPSTSRGRCTIPLIIKRDICRNAVSFFSFGGDGQLLVLITDHTSCWGSGLSLDLSGGGRLECHCGSDICICGNFITIGVARGNSQSRSEIHGIVLCRRIGGIVYIRIER